MFENRISHKLRQCAFLHIHQIQVHYFAELKQRGLTNILKIGLAFSGKRFGIAHERKQENAKKDPLMRESSNVKCVDDRLMIEKI